MLHFLNSLDHSMEYFTGLASPRTHHGIGQLIVHGAALTAALCRRGRLLPGASGT